MARCGKLTGEIQKKICKAVREGLTYERAAELAGIAVATFYVWKKRGERGEKKYVEFLEALSKAEVEGEALNLKIIQQAAKGGRKIRKSVVEYDGSGNVIKRTETVERAAPKETAAMWILERRHRDRWGRYAVMGDDSSLRELAESIAALRGEGDADSKDSSE